jgi:hypothetical protein
VRIIYSQSIEQKLASRGICQKEIVECFENRDGGLCIDTREEHATTPPTHWFVAETNRLRKLKIMYVLSEDTVYLKSAYEATPEICRIYNKYQN